MSCCVLESPASSIWLHPSTHRNCWRDAVPFIDHLRQHNRQRGRWLCPMRVYHVIKQLRCAGAIACCLPLRTAAHRQMAALCNDVERHCRSSCVLHAGPGPLPGSPAEVTPEATLIKASDGGGGSGSGAHGNGGGGGGDGNGGGGNKSGALKQVHWLKVTYGLGHSCMPASMTYEKAMHGSWVHSSIASLWKSVFGKPQPTTTRSPTTQKRPQNGTRDWACTHHYPSLTDQCQPPI
jgi:hypothetical protein